MHTILLKLYVKFEDLASREDGQDMVEYALVIGMLCLGATSASQFLAAGLAQAYVQLSSTLASYTS